MRRLVLLAIGLFALLWTAAADTGSIKSNDILAMSDVRPRLLASDSHEPSDSDRQWVARHPTIAAVTESVWKSALVHAELAAAPPARACDASRLASSPDPPLRSAPHYLRHTPLLI